MRTSSQRKWALTLLWVSSLALAPVLADKPEGGGKSWKSTQKEKKAGARDARARTIDGHDDQTGARAHYFDEHHRAVVRNYYDASLRAGRCPPGLAKKHNGCLPPGQAKKWAIGHPLPRDVVFYDLPPSIVVQLGAPPAGHRFVRVASNILLIAIGTGMVIDAMQDFGR